MGTWIRTQEGEDALGFPGTVTEQLRAQESAPSSLRAAARTGDPEQLGGAQAEEEAPCGGGCAVPGAARRGSGGGSAEGAARPGSANLPAQAPEHRAPGHSPGSRLPRDRQRPGGPRTARTLLPQLSRSAAPPGASRPCRPRALEFLRGLNPGFQSCPATGAVPPAASRGKQPPLSPAPGRGTAAPPTANT